MSDNTQQQPQTPAVKKFEENTVDSIITKVNRFQDSGDLVLPPNYIAENAVRGAWLVLQETVDRNDKPALEVCTRESIANAMFEMVTKGLSVVKKQCYFVVYGNKLELEESYIGKIAIAKRDANLKEVNAVTIYKKDVFEYEVDSASGRKRVVKHDQKLANIIPEEIIGAYAIVTYNDGTIDTEIMTLPQIKLAWAQGGAKGNSPAHKNFPDQMAEKTVIARALKIESGSSDDSAIRPDAAQADVDHQIKTRANKKEVTFEEAQVVEEPEEKPSAIKPSAEFSDKPAEKNENGDDVGF